MPERRSLIPAATLPLAYFTAAHVSFAAACAALALDPGTLVPGPGPRLPALVHLLTLGWVSGSILGALYIVAPLALGIPLRPGAGDRAASWTFVCSTAIAVVGFWAGRPAALGLGALGVLGAIGMVGGRTLAGLRRAPIPPAVKLHIALAFANIALTGALGLAMVVDATGARGWSTSVRWSLAHAHMGILGWATMMIFGVGYRLVPMVLPAAMPTGPSLALSAVLLEVGAVGLGVALAIDADIRVWALLVLAAFGAFFAHVVSMLRARRPPPAELPHPDWSTRQTLLALACGLLAAVLGLVLAQGRATAPLALTYGIMGLVGFVAQLVVGIQGRLVPLHAWYREMDRLGGQPPPMSAHTLQSPAAARAVCLLWLCGLPLLSAGVVRGWPLAVTAGAGLLLAATITNGWHGLIVCRRARQRSEVAVPVPD